MHSCMLYGYLYARLVELGLPGELLPAVDVGVVALTEGRLQLCQLLLGAGGTVSRGEHGQQKGTVWRGSAKGAGSTGVTVSRGVRSAGEPGQRGGHGQQGGPGRIEQTLETRR